MEKKWLLVFLVVLLLVFSVVLVFSDVEEDSFLGEVKSYLVSDEEVLFSPGMIDTKKVISGGEEILEGETTQRGEILDSLNEQLFDEEDVLYFSLPSSIEVDSIFDGTFEESIKIQVDYDYPVAGVSVSGNGEIFSKGGYARVLAEGEDNNVHLIFASDFLGLDDIFDVENFCEWETCHLLTGVVIKYLIIEIKDGYLKLDGVYALREDSPDASRLLSREDYKFSQEGIKVERWNDVISEKGFKWIADETSVSGLSYVEKKKLFGGVSENGELFNNGELPNTFGFEYYKGGIFEIPSEKKTEVKVEEDERVHMSPSNLPPYWDWREVHGENWVTPVKDQRGCGSCWAFASAGATELLVNLYFNQHIDLDLSEQELVSCMPDGDTCNGYWPRIALDYVINNGIVEENCFPYQATDPDCGVPCTQRCNNPVELISITGRDRFDDSNEETLKGMITNNGGVSGGIYSWGHAMNLIGYDKDFLDEETVWIFKNSWGEWWGENGYGRIKTDITDIGWTHALLNPVFSDEVLRQIACADNDGDGYCNWGISETKPGTCPAWCEEEKDCDDDDPNTIECYTPRCDDGIDNDNDGYVDYPDDFGCSSVYDYNEENNGDSECNDGIDNNFNGLIDQEDSMCDSWDDNDEERACEDGIDNDGDGTCDLFGCWIDETWFPKDPECSSYNDPYEDMIAYCPEGFEVYTENYPDDSRCVYNGYNNHLNYDDTLNYCEDENAWLPYSYELSQFCWQLDLRSDDAAGFVRVADPFSSGHKNWHDTGFHFSSPECGDVEYDHCGTRKMNSECEIVEGLYGDDQEAGFVCLKMPGYRYPFECQDGIDNDNDLYTDYPEDPSC
ncbi:MAG: C1 family peptidase, partial [Nanoarchaeota archaeon]|nr:C1 family peptidase [Nanoarchaeota archaeon]